MQLDARQTDALTEMINIGFGRAANALSMMAGEHVRIQVPLVQLYPLRELQQVMPVEETELVTSVVQVFTGRIDGLAMLLLDPPNTTALVKMLDGQVIEPEALSAVDLDMLREIGNIVLSAFTSAFGNLLNIHITFTVPYIRQQSLSRMINSINVENRELEYALLVRVQFGMSRKNVNGFMVIVMGLASLEALLSVMRAEGFL